jgi:hypothetical protein
MAKKLVLMTYTPRALDEEAYSEFIRTIDYPAFRQHPDILDYGCWRITDSVQGGEAFSHFDLMEVSDLSRWQAIAGDPTVRGNVERWTREWSAHGPDHPDQSENLKISFCERYWG